MNLVYREPTQQDKLRIEKFLILLKNDYTPPFSDQEREEELNKIYTKRSKAILSLTRNGQLVGYIVWEKYSKNKKYGYIANLAVHPKYRGMDVSMKLRRMAFNQIKKSGLIGVYYTTYHKNIRMVESSKKLGMEIVRIYPDKYRGPGGKTILFRRDF